MSKGSKRTFRKAEPKPPVDVVDGIPDRSVRRAPWKYVVIGVAFAAWIAFLVYCAAAGRVE